MKKVSRRKFVIGASAGAVAVGVGVGVPAVMAAQGQSQHKQGFGPLTTLLI